MATIYVSYKSEDLPFVREIVSRLEAKHQVFIHYKMPVVGIDWRSYMLDKLRTSDVFVVFASRNTEISAYQNAAIGSAWFCSQFMDQKLIIPVVLEEPIPPTLRHLDCLMQTDRDPDKTARAILEVIESRTRRVRLFVSHSHKDEDLASRLVEVISAGLNVPAGAIRCTSVPGYRLDLGAMAPEALRRELGSAACIIAILTPNSLAAEWVLFELGAAWANAKMAIPLLAGGVGDKDIPGPFRGAAGGQLKDPDTLFHLLDQLERNLGWRRNTELPAIRKLNDLAQYAAQKAIPPAAIEESFLAKKAWIGADQNKILDYITFKLGDRPYISQKDLEDRFKHMPTHIYYRLEQLRLLGFLNRTKIGEINEEPTYGWSVSTKYRQEVGL